MMAVMSICAVVFIVLAIHYVVAAHGLGGLSRSVGSLPAPIIRGAATHARGRRGGSFLYRIRCYFDAGGRYSQSKRDIGFATVLVCLLQTAICFLTVYLAALVWPDFESYPAAETVILDIGRRIGGVWMFGSLTFILLVAGLASALTGQAGASRLLYGMGRDGVLSRRIFAYLDPRFSTPTRSIYLMSAVSLFAALFTRFQIAVELVNFGAFAGFVLVNLSVIRHYFIRLRRRQGIEFFTNLIFPAIGAAVCAYLWMSLSAKSRIAGSLWLALGVVYLAFLTRGFRHPPRALTSLEEAAPRKHRILTERPGNRNCAAWKRSLGDFLDAVKYSYAG